MVSRECRIEITSEDSSKDEAVIKDTSEFDKNVLKDNSSDTEKSSSDDTKEIKNEEAKEEEKSEANGVDSELKEFLDSYEAFIDEYCDFMETYDSSDALMLIKYTEMMSKYADFAAKAEEYDSDDKMSSEDRNYYIEVLTRVNNKLEKVAVSE